MMDKSISHDGFVYDSMLGIKEMKTVIVTMLVLVTNKIVVQRNDVVLQIPFKFLYVTPTALPAAKLTPGRKNVL